MDAVVKSLLERPQPQANVPLLRPTREEAEAAVRVLLRWAGDDPSREGLRDTPKRIVNEAWTRFPRVSFGNNANRMPPTIERRILLEPLVRSGGAPAREHLFRSDPDLAGGSGAHSRARPARMSS